MIKRRKTKTVKVGNVKLGSEYPVVIQSMTKVHTTDVEACIAQTEQLKSAGCGFVRIAVPTKADTKALARIIKSVDIPIIADIHFSPDRAIEAIEAGASKIRLNPGNIKNTEDILRIIDAAKANGVAIRAGINEASIRDLKKDIEPERRTELMLAEIKAYVKIFEGRGFENLVLSAKSADTIRTIEVNRAMAKEFDYPIHLGLTHAGLPEEAIVPSSIALGALLSEGIGDTVRISIAGDPVKEAEIAKEILASLGLYELKRAKLIVCPTCGRCQIDVVSLAGKVRKLLDTIEKPIRVAVMGCVVNGPGEAADADIAICAAKGKGFIYRHGEKISSVPEDELLDALQQEINKLA